MNVSYTHDAVGNRLSRTVTLADGTMETTTYTYDDNDRLLIEQGPQGVTTYSWDDNGNMAFRSGPEGLTTYTWDEENRLVAVQTPTHTLEFGYDDDCIRFYKVVDGNRTDFLIDSNQTYQQVLQEGDHLTGTLLAHYTYGHDLLVQNHPGSGTGYYLYDAQLSTSFLTDPAANIVNTYEYSASGPFLTRNDPFPNPFTYTGEYFDPETELLYLRARYLDLLHGRFMNQDKGPLSYRLSQSINRYVYCMNHPEMCIDFSGNQSIIGTMVTQSIIYTILIPAGFGGAAGLALLTAYFMPSHAFMGPFTGSIIGFRGSINAGSSMAKLCGAHPACGAASLILTMFSLYGGVEVYFSNTMPMSVWVYGYGGAGINLKGLRGIMKDEKPGIDVSFYGGFIWDVDEPNDYTKWFFCTSLNALFGIKNKVRSLLAKFGKVGLDVAVCSSIPERGEKKAAHGFYSGINLAGKSPYAAPINQVSSFSYYFYMVGSTAKDRPQPEPTISGLIRYWWWPLQLPH